MNRLDLDGLYWLAGTPDRKVRGRLRFDARKGARLDLSGSLHDLRATGTFHFAEYLDRDPVRILGAAGTRLVTLDECTNTELRLSGVTSEEYRPRLVFDGVHFDRDEVPSFSSLATEIRHLTHWVGKSGISIDSGADGDINRIGKLSATVVPIEGIMTSRSFGELEISYQYTLCGDHIVETQIKQNCTAEVRFAEPKALNEALQVCVALQQIVTIGVDAPVSISSVRLRPARMNRPDRAGIGDDQIRLYAEFPGSDLPKESLSSHVSKMLFTFDDIGGVDGLAAWIEVAKEFEPVVGLLTSHWFMPTLYVENRFFNAITAAETLQRIRCKKQNIDFLKTLKALASQAGETFSSLVGDAEAWAKRVRQTRINRVVHRGLFESGDSDELYWLAESVYFLVVLSLLRECGVPETAMAGIRNRGRFVALSKRLRELV